MSDLKGVIYYRNLMYNGIALDLYEKKYGTFRGDVK